MSILELASKRTIGDIITKPLSFYEIYDRYLNKYEGNINSIVEIGVFKGQSTKVFSEYFDKSSILALDLQDHGVDFEGCDNIDYRLCNQNDGDTLRSMISGKFPDGVDIVIEDASHIGSFSKNTFEAVMPLVKSGGIYIIEDWGTGYWANWADGSAYENLTAPSGMNDIRCRLPSHDFGMVGFIKSIVDMVGYADINHFGHNPHAVNHDVKEMHLFAGTCVLVKA